MLRHKERLLWDQSSNAQQPLQCTLNLIRHFLSIPPSSMVICYGNIPYLLGFLYKKASLLILCFSTVRFISLYASNQSHILWKISYLTNCIRLHNLSQTLLVVKCPVIYESTYPSHDLLENGASNKIITPGACEEATQSS